MHWMVLLMLSILIKDISYSVVSLLVLSVFDSVWQEKSFTDYSIDLKDGEYIILGTSV